jgi:hypothetical protein
MKNGKSMGIQPIGLNHFIPEWISFCLIEANSTVISDLSQISS